MNLTPSAPVKTASSIIARYRADNPGKRFAALKDGSAVGFWHAEAARWVPLVGKCILGGWMAFSGEMLVNGEPLIKQTDWREVA